MQQILSSREAAAQLGDIDPTTIQRAIGRGELPATRSRERAPWRIQREDLLSWAAVNGFTVKNGNGQAIDPATGEILEVDAEDEAPVSLAERALAAKQRLAGVQPDVAAAERPEGPAEPESNVAAIIMPRSAASSIAADRLALLAQLVKGGHFEAAKIVVEAWAL
jgi:excisionase family DNA binding protein